MSVLECDHIGKSYGSRLALEDLSVRVEAGEILGVLGPNGAGKTTAIRVLTTVIPPDHGSFSVVGIPHTRPAEIRRRVGVLPESAGYPERQTGDEYLRYFARLFGQTRASAQATATTLLGEVGLSDRGASLIATYSRGMRQRLGIARALVNDPRVVFLDEPTLGLDPAGQRQMLDLVRRISQERGVTVLLCTHLLAEVEEACSRVIIMNRGRVVADGTVAEVARLAAAPRTVRFRVGPDDGERASRRLAGLAGVANVESSAQPGSFFAVLDNGSEAARECLRALADADIGLVSFELEGARLSDAFLAMTEDA
jgi:ABC-2 type transport system ATP-binding protein